MLAGGGGQADDAERGQRGHERTRPGDRGGGHQLGAVEDAAAGDRGEGDRHRLAGVLPRRQRRRPRAEGQEPDDRAGGRPARDRVVHPEAVGADDEKGEQRHGDRGQHRAEPEAAHGRDLQDLGADDVPHASITTSSTSSR